MKRRFLAFNIQVPLASYTVLTVRKPMGSTTLLLMNGPTWVRVPLRSDRYLQRRIALLRSSMTLTHLNTLPQQA